jgi:flavin-dependent dehydrogenase
MDSFDVVVVGGRCAGAATARLLAGAGLRVLVVDRAGEGSDTISGHMIKPKQEVARLRDDEHGLAFARIGLWVGANEVSHMSLQGVRGFLRERHSFPIAASRPATASWIKARAVLPGTAIECSCSHAVT